MKQPDTTLAKADTVALWHAVQWMESVLREWRRDGFKDDADRAKHQGQLETLRLAKRALRKVNAIRKAQAATISKLVAVGPLRSPTCWCESCDIAANGGLCSRMSLCPECGNKRCPRATYHDNACTGSNEPGQKGSSWEQCRSTEKPQVERKTAGAAGAQPRNHRVSRAQEQQGTAGGAGA
ncbi:hypothetical protein [Pulveribacter sp.]|uniref:hypothetical protein n=1 Tax=Pulveribacter sp. TaxID=2678893 RepID=UPI0028A7F8A9|nr:hypothetical protein [Pulveribacter sp.]